MYHDMVIYRYIVASLIGIYCPHMLKHPWFVMRTDFHLEKAFIFEEKQYLHGAS